MLIIEVLIVLLSTYIGIKFLISKAKEFGLVDKPNSRSIHSSPIPRGAGIIFTISPLLVLMLFHAKEMISYIGIILALLVVIALGVYDDKNGSSPLFKFIVIAFATLTLWQGGLLINHIGLYFGKDVTLGFLAIPFTYFAVSGFTNAMNLIDGLDGLAGSIALLMLGVLLGIGLYHNDKMLIYFSALFIAGLIVFLYFNWYPASIFMGDSGSLSLGFLISALSIKALEYIPTVSVLYLGAIPILDTLVAMFRRKLNGRSATKPDKCHFHHLLLRRFQSVPKSVLILIFIQIPFTVVGLLIPKQIEQGYFLLGFFGFIALGLIWVNYMIKREKIEC